MIEASRFGTPPDGWIGQGTTNAQFTLQPYTHSPGINSLYNNANVHRFTLENKDNITLTMVWTGPNQPVTFNAYYGIHDLAQVKNEAPAITWTTSGGIGPHSRPEPADSEFWPTNGALESVETATKPRSCRQLRSRGDHQEVPV